MENAFLLSFLLLWLVKLIIIILDRRFDNIQKFLISSRVTEFEILYKGRSPV